MVFVSIDFFFLLIITLLLFYCPIANRFQKWILISASFIFYAYNIPVIIFLLITSILLNGTISFLLQKPSVKKWHKLLLTTGVIMNLLLLCFYKYKAIFISRDKFIFQSQAVDIDTLFYLALPIGISFYTFQGISLLVDFYRGKYKLKKRDDFFFHLSDIALYLSFFPQLIAGPIVKAHDFLYQITPKKVRTIEFDKALMNIILGYFLKMVIADNLHLYVNKFKPEMFSMTSSLDLVLYLISNTIYIFSDFAGYSYIAIGVGYLFGFKLPPNFDFPFVAKNLSELWRRWHISLSQWLTEYLYIPLGGNRKGIPRTVMNLIITMTLGGLWHGSSLGFALWGFLHGVVLILERVVPLRFPQTRFFDSIRILRTFSILTFLFIFFRFDEVSIIWQYISYLMNNTQLSVDVIAFSEMTTYCMIVIMMHIFHKKISCNKELVIKKYSYLFYALLLILIFTDHGFPFEFLYYRF